MNKYRMFEMNFSPDTLNFVLVDATNMPDPYVLANVYDRDLANMLAREYQCEIEV